MALKNWKELPYGGVITEAGNANEYKTGDWRVRRPVWSQEKCSSCMICSMYCPDASIVVKEGKMTGIEYKHCKGCGICAHECPKDAIEMKNESDYRK